MTTTSFYEAVNHLLDFSAGTSDERAVRVAKRSVQEAYRALSVERNWTWYYRRSNLVLEAAYLTGTIEFDLTGGTHERQVTLTGGTWPETAQYGWLWLNNYRFKVDRRIDGSIITLKAGRCPTEDIVAGTPFVWYRDTYPLPDDLRAMDQMVDDQQLLLPYRATPGELETAFFTYNIPSQPAAFTIYNDEDYANSLAAVFYPPPDRSYRMSYIYQRQPTPVRLYEKTTGTVTTTAGSVTVTGSGTAWDSHMVKSLLTVGTTAALPTGFDGTNPAIVTGVIKSVESATSLTLYEAASDSTAGAKHRVSDAIDVRDGTMFTAFLRLCEYQFAAMFPRDDARERLQAAKLAVLQAKEADKPYFGTGYSASWPWRDPGDMPVGPDLS